MTDNDGIVDNWYRKRPVKIRAILYNGDNIQRVRSFIGHWLQDVDGPTITIRTLEGDMRAEPGDWIIRGVADECYPCRADIFAATYEACAHD